MYWEKNGALIVFIIKPLGPADKVLRKCRGYLAPDTKVSLVKPAKE